MNISQTVRDGANISTANTKEVAYGANISFAKTGAYWFSIGILAFDLASL